MFEVTQYEPPYIFVRSRQTAETYRFLVGTDGGLVHEGTRFDQGDPRRTAIEYLFQTRKQAEPQTPLSA
jgi:hypothetical protein